MVEISLKDIFKVVSKRIKLIVAITFIAILISAILSFFVLTPIYEASTQILVNQKESENQSNIQSDEIQANLQLINTYSVIIKSPKILNKVIKDLDLNTTASSLAKQITVSNEEQSQVVNLTVQNKSGSQAVEIANTIAAVFQYEIKNLMNVDNVNILSEAELPENPTPVKPNKLVNIMIALVIGLMVGVGLAFLLEYLDTTVKSETEIEELIGLPLIGFISKMPDSDIQIPSNGRSLRTVKEKINI